MRNLNAFTTPVSLLIIDECHRLGNDDDSQYQKVIRHLREVDPELRVLGLTATPYRLGKVWIYQFHYHGTTRYYMIRGDERCFFRDYIFELSLHYNMVKHGYIVLPERLDMLVQHYDFSRLAPNVNGDYPALDLNGELQRQRRIIPLIVAQIRNYGAIRQGLMIFAATVEHDGEILSLLPPDQAVLVTAPRRPPPSVIG